MNIILLEPALDDFLEATTYFDGISDRLGRRFRQCVEKTIETIIDFPEASAVIRKGYRVRQVVRFRNYGILHRIRDGCIFIHGIFYLPRGPPFSRSRIQSNNLDHYTPPDNQEPTNT